MVSRSAWRAVYLTCVWSQRTMSWLKSKTCATWPWWLKHLPWAMKHIVFEGLVCPDICQLHSLPIPSQHHCSGGKAYIFANLMTWYQPKQCYFHPMHSPRNKDEHIPYVWNPTWPYCKYQHHEHNWPYNCRHHKGRGSINDQWNAQDKEDYPMQGLRISDLKDQWIYIPPNQESIWKTEHDCQPIRAKAGLGRAPQNFSLGAHMQDANGQSSSIGYKYTI